MAGARPRAHSVVSRLERIAVSAWFAYGSILLIQAKVLWGIWQYRDLSAGDTSDYFVYANSWTNHLQVEPLFSPLYTIFWGTLRWFISDAYAVDARPPDHRSSSPSTILVLAVLRRLLIAGDRVGSRGLVGDPSDQLRHALRGPPLRAADRELLATVLIARQMDRAPHARRRSSRCSSRRRAAGAQRGRPSPWWSGRSAWIAYEVRAAPRRDLGTVAQDACSAPFAISVLAIGR